MVNTSTSKGKHVRAKLTDTQKAARRTKVVKLSNAITTAQDAYHEEACAIAKDNGHIQVRTGLEGMYIAVRGDVEQYHEPKLFYTAKVGSFIKDVLGMEPKRFALKVKSWVVGDFDSGGTVNRRLSLTKLISLCRQLIQDGLDIILPTLKHPPKKKVQMNYDNYEGKIVETYGVALENFPGTVQNPGKIGHREDLIKLYDLLFKGTCSWTKLTNDELVEHVAKNKQRQAHGEQIYKARKRQEKASIAKSTEMVEDTDEDNASSSESGVDSPEA
ncbi:uncharacterized protein EDB91DRAFT_1252938 [Suillus paluster]|uniref:uncharacterized protein n=1 Tax=Suillus paluster TaxID=48578 RepID=UPI001B873853|nr:uncharacterized protein EDB91DRAFT_1252938 [Suillus paluster]KAG1729623.1 hypothetical protein EDB91DRAFT_1252938 [Suillus paluster]